ncbi:hypothetical protein [Cerasicoccus arenae]|uniref:Uncharacterized protein n=1 Tax=Cerasicoccus arenae TaxID=424488 RepID=A0A8J3DBP8_9BACT|nr:hypothetical protein [Cerasicoccus arenae]MBK1858243.1 hypothetical protein [Cerasicoccus arenae]GHC02123.1 hypothetical protein GCM10007047_18300 [Cerasicoccus arenae]
MRPFTQILLLALALIAGACKTVHVEPAPLVAGQVSQAQQIDLAENLHLALVDNPNVDPDTILPAGLDLEQRATIIRIARKNAGL